MLSIYVGSDGSESDSTGYLIKKVIKFEFKFRLI